MMVELILLTDTFPFDGAAEGSFISPELPFLINAFDRVRIVPCHIDGSRYEFPDSLCLDLSLGESIPQSPCRWLSASLLKAVFRVATDLNCSALELRWFLRSLSRSSRIYAWLHRSLRSGSISCQNTLFYSYWCLEAAEALACFAYAQRNLKFVSRAHRVDLYPMCRGLSRFPFHGLILETAESVFPVSEHGAVYLRAIFERFAAKVKTARLGVNGTSLATATSETRILVSCSAAVPVKRIDLIASLVRDIAVRCARLRIEWHHFGDGPTLEAARLAAASFPPNLLGVFHGQQPNSLVRRFYCDNWVDLFVNMSDSEGAPVSIMEASAAAIPVVGRDVGGVAELLDEGNGFLLNSAGDWSPVLERIAILLARGEYSAMLRNRSLKLWSTKYDAEKNFSEFAQCLRKLV